MNETNINNDYDKLKTNEDKKCGFVAMIGSPNAGKSTLLNTIIGDKVSIVTPKVQTTRNLISGIKNIDNTQIIFMDTPGIFKPNGTLENKIVNTAIRGLKSADKIAMIIDPKCYKSSSNELIIDFLQKHKMKVTLIINKRDLVSEEILLQVTDYLYKKNVFDQVFMVSALKKYNINDIVNYFAQNLPIGPWLYNDDQISDIPTKFLVAEITREKLYLLLNKELPYSLVVETEKMEEKDGVMSIMQVIYVEKENQKKIILGQGGQKIKHVGMKARKELEYILDCKVFLKLFVKVRKDWVNRASIYHNMGVEAPQ